VASLFLTTFGGAAIGFNIAEAAQLADPERFNSMPLPAYGGGAGLIIGFLVSAFPLFIVFVLIDIAENARRSALVSAESRPQESGQDDKWSFCLTAGTLCPANQERQ
jgi:hypothetical protein